MYNKDPKLKFKNIYSNEIHIYIYTFIYINELKIFYPNSLYATP